jgi:hypothetical protein
MPAGEAVAVDVDGARDGDRAAEFFHPTAVGAPPSSSRRA